MKKCRVPMPHRVNISATTEPTPPMPAFFFKCQLLHKCFTTASQLLRNCFTTASQLLHNLHNSHAHVRLGSWPTIKTENERIFSYSSTTPDMSSIVFLWMRKVGLSAITPGFEAPTHSFQCHKPAVGVVLVQWGHTL